MGGVVVEDAAGGLVRRLLRRWRLVSSVEKESKTWMSSDQATEARQSGEIALFVFGEDEDGDHLG